MKKKDIIEGKIIKTEFPNKGTFICEDQKVTVKGVIDGQTIKGQVTKKRKSGCVVRLLDVLEKSPLEDAKPVCPHFGICGGCFYQTVSYENQLKIKEGMVRDLLKIMSMMIYGEKSKEVLKCMGIAIKWNSLLVMR